ncbi:MAG: hypothetical protein LBI78_03710 [Campylobacteraceae bacterium]|jgi:hypothetical protein|nr:hypothetical protein [Campylobacteraceae bacterium]
MLKRFFDILRDKAALLIDALKQQYYKRFGKAYGYKIIFVDTQHVTTSDSDIFDIVLSPKYYWTKMEELPVKYAFQAKEYAPSVFDGFIPKGDYSYKAIKQDGKFLLFAYDAKDILERLESLGIKPSHVRNTYFAQTEFANYPLAIKVDNENSLITHNEKVIKMPLSLAKEHVSMNEVLQTLKPSKNIIKLGKFNRFYEKQGALKGIIYVLAILIAIFLGELLYLSHLLSSQENRKDEILKQYSLPSTEIQLNALLKQQEKTNKQQSVIRENMSKIFGFSLLQNEYFKNIEVNQMQISIVLHVNDKSRSAVVRDYFQKSFIIYEFTDDTDDIKIKLRYE